MLSETNYKNIIRGIIGVTYTQLFYYLGTKEYQNVHLYEHPVKYYNKLETVLLNDSSYLEIKNSNRPLRRAESRSTKFSGLQLCSGHNHVKSRVTEDIGTGSCMHIPFTLIITTLAAIRPHPYDTMLNLHVATFDSLQIYSRASGYSEEMERKFCMCIHTIRAL